MAQTDLKRAMEALDESSRTLVHVTAERDAARSAAAQVRKRSRSHDQDDPVKQRWSSVHTFVYRGSAAQWPRAALIRSLPRQHLMSKTKQEWVGGLRAIEKAKSAHAPSPFPIRSHRSTEPSFAGCTPQLEATRKSAL